MKIGDQVRVKKLDQKRKSEIRTIDPETLYYIEKFEGKVGQLFDVTLTSEGFKNYHINFGKDIGIFYEKEIEYVTD
jgi:hypothetical protein